MSDSRLLQPKFMILGIGSFQSLIVKENVFCANIASIFPLCQLPLASSLSVYLFLSVYMHLFALYYLFFLPLSLSFLFVCVVPSLRWTRITE